LSGLSAMAKKFLPFVLKNDRKNVLSLFEKKRVSKSSEGGETCVQRREPTLARKGKVKGIQGDKRIHLRFRQTKGLVSVGKGAHRRERSPLENKGGIGLYRQDTTEV